MVDLNTEDMASLDVGYWVELKKIRLQAGLFTFKGFEYQVEPMSSKSRRLCYLKARQSFGATINEVLKDLHGMIMGIYKLGVAHIFPTNDEVGEFSKSIFKPLIAANKKAIGNYVKNVAGGTDTTTLKKVNDAMLWLRGARLGQKIGDSEESTSSKTAGFSVDKCVFDEVDFMDPEAIVKYIASMGMSPHQHEVYLGNPSHEDFGIDLIFKCITPDTKILTTDLEWKRADELENGDYLIGFDEEKVSGNKTRRYRSTKVTNCEKTELPCFKIYLDDGTIVTVSKEHKWLTEKDTNTKWKTTEKLKVGDKLFSIGTWDEEKTKDAGWISGIYDGEGCILRSKKDVKQRKGQSTTIHFSQNDGIVLRQVKKFLDDRNFTFHKISNSHGCFILTISGGLPQNLRFLGMFKPIRLMQKASIIWEDVSVGNDRGNTKKPKVVKIEDVGRKSVIALGTEHKTFIANGLLSHNSSDQRYWFRKCSCSGLISTPTATTVRGNWTCAEKSFPQCVKIRSDGTGYVGCDKCGKEVLVWAGPGTGQWVPDYPDKSKYMHGYMASQLITPFNDPAEILEDFVNPPFGDLANIYRLRLGRPYSNKDEKLRKSDVLANCGNDAPATRHDGPCAMGVDIGKFKHHLVIGIKTSNDRYEIIRACTVTSKQDIYDFARRYNVQSDVLDIGCEYDLVREYQKSSRHKTFLCQYSDTQITPEIFNDNTGVAKVNRTEIFDRTHRLITNGNIVLPCQCPETEEFARQCCNCAKFEEKDKRSGGFIYRYRPTGDRQDHFRSALNYFILAASGHRIRVVSQYKTNRQTNAQINTKKNKRQLVRHRSL